MCVGCVECSACTVWHTQERHEIRHLPCSREQGIRPLQKPGACITEGAHIHLHMGTEDYGQESGVEKKKGPQREQEPHRRAKDISGILGKPMEHGKATGDGAQEAPALVDSTLHVYVPTQSDPKCCENEGAGKQGLCEPNRAIECITNHFQQGPDVPESCYHLLTFEFSECSHCYVELLIALARFYGLAGDAPYDTQDELRCAIQGCQFCVRTRQQPWVVLVGFLACCI